MESDAAIIEVDRLVGLYTEQSGIADAQTGVRGIVAAMLASPNFLFRPELGAADSSLPGAKQLTAFELASRLSSLLWASLPDDELLDAAAAGQLETLGQVEDQARRMIDIADKSHPAIAAFYAAKP